MVVTETMLRDCRLNILEMFIEDANNKGYVPVYINSFPLKIDFNFKEDEFLMQLTLNCCYVGRLKAKKKKILTIDELKLECPNQTHKQNTGKDLKN